MYRFNVQDSYKMLEKLLLLIAQLKEEDANRHALSTLRTINSMIVLWGVKRHEHDLVNIEN